MHTCDWHVCIIIYRICHLYPPIYLYQTTYTYTHKESTNLYYWTQYVRDRLNCKIGWIGYFSWYINITRKLSELVTVCRGRESATKKFYRTQKKIRVWWYRFFCDWMLLTFQGSWQIDGNSQKKKKYITRNQSLS